MLQEPVHHTPPSTSFAQDGLLAAGVTTAEEVRRITTTCAEASCRDPRASLSGFALLTVALE
jgi:hypothetical protein